MLETIIITGASGLLGRALVERFAGAGYRVLAQYHRHKGRKSENVRWLAGDFSSVKSTAAFLKRHTALLSGCSHVIHNFGPIAPKDTAAVTGVDLLASFQAQLQPALDITRFLLARAPLRSVLFIAFEETGRVRPYKKILPFAMAKNSLPLLTRSLAAVHPGVCFNVFSPPSLKGAAVLPPGAKPVAPDLVAEFVIKRIMRRRRSGCHYRWQTAATRRAAGRDHG